MSHEHRLRFKTLVMALLMGVCGNTGELMLARGMKQIGSVELPVPGLRHALVSTIQSGSIWIGILFLIGFTLCYMTAVSWADFSFVMPAGAFGYAVQTMLAIVVLHEVVSPKRWIGFFMICVGVLLVGQTKPNTTNNTGPVAP